MSTPLIIALIVGLAIAATAIRALIAAPRLSIAVRVAAALTFVVLALFCAFGFAAAMGPGDDHIIWRIIYGGVFHACAFAVVRLALARRSTETTQKSE